MPHARMIFCALLLSTAACSPAMAQSTPTPCAAPTLAAGGPSNAHTRNVETNLRPPVIKPGDKPLNLREEMRSELKIIQREVGITTIFVTHDQEEALAMSDEIVVMNKGQVVQQGLKSEVLNPPYPAYTELLLSSVPQMDPDWLTGLLQRRQKANA